MVLDLVPGPLPQVYLAARPVVREVVKTLTEESLSVVFEPCLPSSSRGRASLKGKGAGEARKGGGGVRR